MNYFLTWYLIGLVGMCLITYVDAQENCSGQGDHLAIYLLFSIFGPINLGVGIYAMYFHIKEQGE